MRSLDLVNSYFNREAERFDAIYEENKPLHQQLGDNLFRRVILERYSLVVNAIGAPGATMLDVGCGPGRYGVELARRGAERCVGVDVAAAMIEIARTEAGKAGVADRCLWEVSDWLSWNGSEQFDAVVAMGYYDYLEDPLPHLEKMIARARGRVFASFPKRWTFRTGLRIARFKLANGFVRFYSRKEVVELFRRAGHVQFLSLVDLGRDLVAIYDAGASRGRK
ncbi:MAG TPA: methyltransferase domain-containing protein [Gemmatimonadales bacterium]|jgi:2-polyprenyl-3-methyl-5-hydroxy-6-metoxy-1,4-benzoquinol methylase